MSPAQPAASTAPRATRARPQMRAHSITRALNIIGDRWSLMLLYYVFLGVRRFSDLLEMTGMVRSVLTSRLRRLEKAGLLRRERYQVRPTRHEYRLTEQGRDLYDVSLAIIRWDRVWHYDPDCPAHHIVHRACGREFTPELRCAACEQIVDAHDVSWQDGPGAGYDRHPPARAHRRSSTPIETLKPPHPIMQRSFEILGDRWTALTLAAAWFRKKRFNEFQSYLQIATNILSDRLARLVKLGILERRTDQPRPEYHLTQEGLDLYPISVTLLRWGDRWLAGAKGPPLLLTHRCGAPLAPVMTCNHCKAPVGPADYVLSDAARLRLWRDITPPAAMAEPARV